MTKDTKGGTTGRNAKRKAAGKSTTGKSKITVKSTAPKDLKPLLPTVPPAVRFLPNTIAVAYVKKGDRKIDPTHVCRVGQMRDYILGADEVWHYVEIKDGGLVEKQAEIVG